MERMCQFLRYLPPHRIWVLLTVLFLTSKEQDTVPVRLRRKSTKYSYKLRSCSYSCRAYPDSKIASKRFPIQLPRMMRKLRKSNNWLAALQPVLLSWSRMQRPSPVDPARQDLGIYSDIAMAPQPLGPSGPIALGYPMTIGIQDADLIPPKPCWRTRAKCRLTTIFLRAIPQRDYQVDQYSFGENPTCQPTIDLLQFIVKQVPRQSGLYLNHEPNVKTLLSDIKRMASLTILTVPFAASKQLLLSANPNPLKTEKLENNLHLCGESWLTSSKFSSLIEMTKVHSSSQRSTLARMSSASKIDESELENRCANLLLFEAGKHLPLFHLSCLSLVFLLMCCNIFSLEPTRSMCDGRSLASPLFRRLAGRGAFFRGFPFRWVLHFVLHLTRSVAVHDSPSCYREDSLDECERPCDTLSCLLFSALWLRCNYSTLVPETQSAKDLDLTCFATFPFSAVTCLPVRPMSLDWPIDPFARSDLSRSSLPPEVPSSEQQFGAFLQGGMDVAPSFPKACDVLLGTPEALLDLFSQDKETESSNSNISKDSLKPTTLYVSRRCMGRTSIFRLFKYWLCNFSSLVPLFLIKKTREDRLSAFARTFCLRVLLFHM